MIQAPMTKPRAMPPEIPTTGESIYLIQTADGFPLYVGHTLTPRARIGQHLAGDSDVGASAAPIPPG